MNFNFEIVCDKPKNFDTKKNWWKHKMNIKRLVCEQWAKHRVYKIQNESGKWNGKCRCGFCCETDIQIDFINATQRPIMCECVRVNVSFSN